MGHTRLGAIPKTRKWNELVEQVAGLDLTGNVPAAAASIDAIAAQTLDAAQKGLDKAAEDAGVCYTFYLITQVALASRTTDWGVRSVSTGSACPTSAAFSTSPPRCRMQSTDTSVRIHQARQT